LGAFPYLYPKIPTMSQVAKILIFAGVFLLFLGLLFWLFGNLFSWFGKLPGDIRIERENFVFYAPITSMIVVSILLNIVLYVIFKLWNR